MLYPQEELRDYEDLISKGVFSAQKARLNTTRIMIHTFYKPNYYDLAHLIASYKKLFYLCRSSLQNKNQNIKNFLIVNI